MQTASDRITALTCISGSLIGVAVALVIGAFLGILGAEGLGDALVGGGRLAVDAVGVDLQQDRDAVPGAARDLAVPGGAPATRLAGLVGRGRAFEIFLGGEDFDGDLAERYGYVNRAVPDAEFADFVDAYARRVSNIDQRALLDTKHFINAASHPDEVQLMATMRAFGEAVRWGQPGEFEPNVGTHIAELTAES